MSAVDDVARMLALVPWLLERPGASLEEIATAFGVAESTIHRDLTHLDYCGLPGLGGGDLFEVDIVGDRVVVRMAEELQRPLRLAPREALRLVLTVEAVAHAIGDDVPALRSALSKVRAAAGVPATAAVHVATDGEHWLEPIRSALRDGRRVTLDYQGRGDSSPRSRTVDPWALLVADGAWYLQGHDHDSGERRTFRLDRIADLTVLDAASSIPAPAGELPPPRYEPGPDDVTVELLLSPEARWLADSVTPERADEDGRGGLRLVFSTDALPWVERLVLTGGGAVEVVRPDSIRTNVAERAARAIERYSGVSDAP